MTLMRSFGLGGLVHSLLLVVPLGPSLKAADDALPASTFHWPDRRPIGAIFLATSGKNWPANPRGYFNDPQMDVSRPEGKALLVRRMDELAAKTIAFTREVGSQGVLVWDIEGGEMPHAITYLGDPRVLPQVAPEMDEIADGFFKKLKDSGLRVGVCIRPSSIVFKDPSKPELYPWIQTRYGHTDSPTPVDVLDEKIAYAKKRWGCTLYYIDTNYTPLIKDGVMVRKKGGAPEFRMLSAAEIAELHRRHPDVLLWPEFQESGYFASGSGYAEYHRVGDFSAAQRKNYPEAFRVWMPRLNVEDVYMAWDEFLEKGVMQGEVFLFECSPSQNAFGSMLRQAHEEAGLRQAANGRTVTSGESPSGQIRDADAATRYAAVRALKPAQYPQILPELLGALEVETVWAVKRNLLDCLAASPDRRATESLAKVLKSNDPALAYFAGQALGRQGTPEAFAALKEALTGQSGAARSAARGLGLTGKPEAAEILGGILLDRAASPEMRWASIDGLGALRDKKSVPVLVQYLKSLAGTPANTSRKKAVEALGKIGDVSAVPALVEALADNDFNLLRNLVAESLTRITGFDPAKNRQDIKSWKAWLEKK